MAEHGNPNQWGKRNWPPERLIKVDIEKGCSYVCENEQGIVIGTFFFNQGESIDDTECLYETRILAQKDFKELYLPEWSNALCKDRKHLDVLGVGAYDNNRLVGFAACSADCDYMWQIGVDVLPKYRQKGIASALTSRLAKEIMDRGKVPFYCCAWSNIRSAGNAVKSGFIPAWFEMSVKPKSIVDEMNY